MAGDAEFARTVAQNPTTLTTRYGLTEAEAAVVVAMKVDTSASRPGRLEERLSRSGGVFGSALAVAVDSFENPGTGSEKFGGSDFGGSDTDSIKGAVTLKPQFASDASESLKPMPQLVPQPQDAACTYLKPDTGVATPATDEIGRHYLKPAPGSGGSELYIRSDDVAYEKHATDGTSGHSVKYQYAPPDGMTLETTHDGGYTIAQKIVNLDGTTTQIFVFRDGRTETLTFDAAGTVVYRSANGPSPAPNC